MMVNKITLLVLSLAAASGSYINSLFMIPTVLFIAGFLWLVHFETKAPKHSAIEDLEKRLKEMEGIVSRMSLSKLK